MRLTPPKPFKTILLTLSALLVLSPAAPAQDADGDGLDRHLLKINVGSLLGNISEYKDTFKLAYDVLRDLTKDPDKVSSYSADLPHKVHVGDELEFTVANADDEATFVFDGVTQTVLMNQPSWKKVVKVRREGENLILFSINQGLINPNAWHGDLVVRNLTSNEELIDHHPAGNDYLIPGRKRIYLFKFKAEKHWYDLFK